VRLKSRGSGRPLGEIEESFAATLTPGDTFLIGGEVVTYHSLREMTVQVTRESTKKPKIAVFSGTKFATSTVLSHRVLDKLQAPDW
ncbi:MAG TPA: DNA ligase-associated DEXH box helicase, partial [Rhodobacteraceae bacterium]|nr:DNA ligase-associated DEXH box helicase [Paracoccaceae bacterium]